METANHKNSNIALGLFYGLMFGAAFGQFVLGSIGSGVAAGMALGVAVGATLDSIESNRRYLWMGALAGAALGCLLGVLLGFLHGAYAAGLGQDHLVSLFGLPYKNGYVGMLGLIAGSVGMALGAVAAQRRR